MNRGPVNDLAPEVSPVLLMGCGLYVCGGGSYSLGEPFMNLIVGDPDGATFLLENRALSPKLTKTLTCSPVFYLN